MMFIFVIVLFSKNKKLTLCEFLFLRIYVVHDEVKDKAFELELSWVGTGKR